MYANFIPDSRRGTAENWNLKRSFVVQNKLHGPPNNACSREKRRHYNSEKCVVWAEKQPALGLICAHKEANGCFVASDWLKRR